MEWLSITRDVLPSVAAAVATYLVTAWLSHDNRPFKPWLDLTPVAAGTVAFISVYVVIKAVDVLRGVVGARRTLLSAAEAARQQRLVDAGPAPAMRAWLRAALADSSLGVSFAAIFGSLAGDYKTRDADVIVQLGEASDTRLRRRTLKTKSLAFAFHGLFDVPLHIQFFSAREEDALEEFVRRAGKIVTIRGEKPWAKS
jgi:hypothetical protein